MMDPLSEYPRIIGDDLGYYSMRYADVPSGFRFEDLEFPADRPLTYALKDKLSAFASSYYRNYEIVGETLVDFKENLEIDMMLNLDTLEKALEVYQDDISKPTQSRIITRTYDIADKREQTNSSKIGSDGNTTGESTDYEIPYDNRSDAQGTTATKSKGTTKNTTNTDGSSTDSYTHKGTESEEWSDVGVAPNYTLLNGFLDNNRTYYAIFISFFRDDFVFGDAYYG